MTAMHWLEKEKMTEVALDDFQRSATINKKRLELNKIVFDRMVLELGCDRVVQMDPAHVRMVTVCLICHEQILHYTQQTTVISLCLDVYCACQ